MYYKIMKYLITLLLSTLFLSAYVSAHCQIPCGIYDDPRQFSELKEHVATIKKSIQSINNLKPSENPNQLVRWVTNKETHATSIQTIMSNYFLAQRIKIPENEDKSTLRAYAKIVENAHKIIILAMKTKQNTNESIADDLLAAINNFEKKYNN